jgi:hypothetical protein
MAKVTRAASQAKFEDTDYPSGSDFADFHQSVLWYDTTLSPNIKGLAALGFNICMQTIGAEWGDINTGSALTDNRLHLAYIGTPEFDTTVSSVTFYQSTLGDYTADQENRIGLYELNNGTGVLTLVASTANNGSLWKTSLGLIDTNFSASASVTSGSPYFIAALYNSSAQVTQPQILGDASNVSSTVAIGTASIELSGGINTQNTLPATFNASSVASISQRFWFKVF